MDEGKRTKKNIWNDDDGAKRPAKEKKSWKGLFGFLVFFLILLVVLGIVMLAAYRDGTGFDVLRRYLHYGGAEKAGVESVYDYDASLSNRFAVLEDHLVVLSSIGLEVLSPDGETVWEKSLNLSLPALDASGERAVAYDVGGTLLYVVDQYGEVLKLDTDEDRIIAANLNKEGWLSVTAEKSGYKGSVRVYNPKMELVFEFNSSRRFVTDACVVGEGKRLAAVTLGQEDGAFVSNVVMYELSETEPKADYDITDSLLIAVETQGEKVLTVTDANLTMADVDGKVTGSYGFAGSFLREFDLNGEGFAVLQLNRYQSGSMGRLVSVGTDGTELGVLDINEEVLDISAAGRYVAVLYADRVVVCNPDLQVYASLTGTDQARGVLMRPDGSVLILGAESAKLFLP